MSPKRIKARNLKGKQIAISSLSSESSPQQQRPIFSLLYLQSDYGLSRCTKDEKAAFADTLEKLSQLTWNEINSSSRHGLGTEKISRNSIRAGIPPHVKEDVNFIAFRFCGKAPMVGYRDRNIFHVVWLDRSFTLYDHGS